MTVRLPTGKQIDPVHLDEFKKQVQMVEAEVLARGTQRFAAAMFTQPRPSSVQIDSLWKYPIQVLAATQQAAP